MKHRQMGWAKLVASMAVTFCLLVSTAEAQFGGGGFGGRGGRGGGAPEDLLAAETPRLPSGKPDLTAGSLRAISGNPSSAGGGMFRRCTPFQENCMEWTNQSQDYTFMHAARLNMNKPLYKPEYWDKVQALDMWTNRDDPVMTCLPLGIPRHGPPARIIASDDDIVMFYRGGLDGGGGYSEFRMVSMSKTEHGPDDPYAYSYYGATTANWEGDTLVLDSIGFTDETWFSRGGFFHTTDLRIIEKFTRTGNQIVYEVTVDDPEVLVEPWVMTPRILAVSNNPTIITERGSCTDNELEQVSTQIRH